MTDAEALQRLAGRTYAVQHNPRCPSPFLVRLVRQDEGGLDMGYLGTRDALGYGKTLAEAVTSALAAVSAMPVERLRPWSVAAPPREE